MKKFAIAGLISVLATIALSGCTSAPAETEEVATDVPAVQEEVLPEANLYVSSYGFKLTFPASWGEVQETIDTGEDLMTINLTLTSEDKEKEMNLFVVANAATGDAYVVDAPFEQIGVGQTYTVYKEVNQGMDILEAQGEDVSEAKVLENGLNEIAATFETVEEEEGGGGMADGPEDYPAAPGL